jgi:hypothetical protein
MTPNQESSRHFLAKIRATTAVDLEDLRTVWDLDVFRHTARELEQGIFEVQGLLSGAEIEQIRHLGYEVEVTADADEIARERSHEHSKQGSD